VLYWWSERSLSVVTNNEFARLTGCDYTMASKIRNGTRKPSTSLFTRIILVFELDAKEAVDAYAGGAVMFSDFLRKHVFDATTADDDTGAMLA
jgi:hypothetical protein